MPESGRDVLYVPYSLNTGRFNAGQERILKKTQRFASVIDSHVFIINLTFGRGWTERASHRVASRHTQTELISKSVLIEWF